MSSNRYYGDAKATATAADGGRKLRALQTAKAGYDSNPSPANQALLASALFDNGKYEEAESLLTALLTEHGDEIPVLFELGFIYKNQNRKEDAVKTWLKIVELDPKHSLSRAAENEAWMLDPSYKPSWMRK